MVEIVERLELPASAYSALTRIAKSQGATPIQVIEVWIEQHQSREIVHALRQEYQQLIEKDLMRALTSHEHKRLDTVCDELNDQEMRSEKSVAWKANAAVIDARFDQIERLLAAMPEKQAGP